jgi:RimJ/RimL family protein N-acetyltransferase
MPDVDFTALESPRLRLRRLRASDLPAFCRYRADPAVARYQSWETFTREEGARFFEEQAGHHPDIPGTWFQMAVTLKQTGDLLGDLGLHTLGDEPRQAEIGFTLAPAAQGKGFATEAVTCVLDYVFLRLGKHRVTALTDAENLPAQRVLERVGMRREGHFRQNVWFKGKWGDECLFAILRTEWVQRQDQLTAGQ